MILVDSNYVFCFYFTDENSGTANSLFEKEHLYDDHVCSLSPKGKYKLCAVAWKLSLSDETNVSIIEDPNGSLDKQCHYVNVDYQHIFDSFPILSLECVVKSEIMANLAQSGAPRFYDRISVEPPQSQKNVHIFYISAGFTKDNLKSVFMHIKVGKYVCSNLYIENMDFNYYGIE